MKTAIESALAEGVRKRELWAWAMYDFANSAYTTVVITAVFNAYFIAAVAKRAPWATLAWTSALAFSYALIVLTAPALGAYADRHHAKKKLLALMTLICVLGTAGLYFAGPESLALTIALIIVSNYAFGSGENLCAAFLPELARPEAMGRISGWGWSLGYLGGLFALGLCLLYISLAKQQGAEAVQFVPVTMLITAGLFLLASLPTFILLRERGHAPAGQSGLWQAFLDSHAQLRSSWRKLRQLPELRRLLLSIISYQAGIQTVIALAAIYAQEALGFQAEETLIMLLIVNVTAAVGAFLCGWMQDHIGHRAALGLSLVLWIATILLLVLAEGRLVFWIAANLAGAALGAAQSAGRALVGYLSPYAERAEFFGLWGLAAKLASIIGPLSYGLSEFLTGNNHRYAMLVTGLFFVIGLVLVMRVGVAQGRARVQAAVGA